MYHESILSYHDWHARQCLSGTLAPYTGLVPHCIRHDGPFVAVMSTTYYYFIIYRDGAGQVWELPTLVNLDTIEKMGLPVFRLTLANGRWMHGEPQGE